MKKLFVLSLLVINLPAFGLTTSNITNGCNANRSNALAFFEANSYTCQNGTFLPADGIACVSCPSSATCSGGTFTYNESVPQGLQFNGSAFTSDLENICSVEYNTLRAIFTRDNYTCANGTFLPANGVACVSCPSGATCGGGWFEFNETQSQGIVMPDFITQNMDNACYADLTNADSNNTSNIHAVFTRNQYTCASGQYLPADAIACTTCQADNYCIGGTYAYNETTAQGATACDAGAHSPVGSSSVSQCITGYTCTSGQYLPKNTTTCASCLTGYTCSGGTYNLDTDNDQGLVANSIAITWQDNDGTTITSNSCTYGQPITLPSNPTRKGYTFTGWRVVNN